MLVSHHSLPSLLYFPLLLLSSSITSTRFNRSRQLGRNRRQCPRRRAQQRSSICMLFPRHPWLLRPRPNSHLFTSVVLLFYGICGTPLAALIQFAYNWNRAPRYNYGLRRRTRSVLGEHYRKSLYYSNTSTSLTKSVGCCGYGLRPISTDMGLQAL